MLKEKSVWLDRKKCKQFFNLKYLLLNKRGKYLHNSTMDKIKNALTENKIPLNKYKNAPKKIQKDPKNENKAFSSLLGPFLNFFRLKTFGPFL
jgi:hypothetical protein